MVHVVFGFKGHATRCYRPIETLISTRFMMCEKIFHSEYSLFMVFIAGAIFLVGCQLSLPTPDLTASIISSPTVTVITSTITPPLETIISFTPSSSKSTPSFGTSNGSELVLKKTFDTYGPHFALSPDGRIIASSNAEKVYALDANNGDLIAEFLKPEASFMGQGSVAFSPDGKKLAVEVNVEGSKGTESDFYLLDSTSLELLEKHAFNGTLIDLKYSPDGKLVAGTGSDRGKIYLWNLVNKDVTLLDSAADHLAFSPLDPVLATGETVSQGGPAVKLWNTKNFTSRGIFTLEVNPNSYYSGAATSVSFSPDGHLLAAVVNGKLRFWDMKSNQEIKSSLNTSDSLVQAIYSNKGNLATLDQNGEIVVYDPNSGTILGKTVFKGIDNPIYFELSFAMMFSPDGEQLLTGGEDNPIQIWEIP